MTQSTRRPFSSYSSSSSRLSSSLLQPPSLEEEDAAIYFRVQRDLWYEWYVIKGNSKTPVEKILAPLYPRPPIQQWESGCGVVGSTIYVLGGADYRERMRRGSGHVPPRLYADVYYIDTRHPKGGWKKGPSMKKPRALPYPVTVDDKMYVIGSTYDVQDEPPPWGEVFEVEQGCWRELGIKTITPRIMSGHGFLDGGKKILFHNEGWPFLFSYDTESDSWETYSDSLGKGCRTASAFVDGVLYFFDYLKPNSLYGLDVSSPENLPKKVCGLDRDSIPQDPVEDEVPPIGRLVSLGKSKLAVLWDFFLYDDDDHKKYPAAWGRLVVRCSKLKMSKRQHSDGQFYFEGETLSVLDYYVMGSSLVDCLSV